MSVTFAIEGVPSLLTTHIPTTACKVADGAECDLMEDCWDFIDGPGVNVSNANAVSVLSTMGLDADPGCLYGTLSLTDFLGHVLVGQGTADDGELPGSDDRTPGKARMIDCGRREGYMSDVMGRLADLCAQADSMGATKITWG